MACDMAAWEMWHAAAAPEMDSASATAMKYCNCLRV